MSLSVGARPVCVSGQVIDLRSKEFDLLRAMVEHSGAAMSRSQLLERVWRDEVDGDTRTVDMHLSRLRDRPTTAGATAEIETVRSFGYRLRERASP